MSAAVTGERRKVLRLARALGFIGKDRIRTTRQQVDGSPDYTQESTLNGSWLCYERGDHGGALVLDAESPRRERNKGQAKRLLWHACRGGRTLDLGHCLPDGEKYLRRYDGMTQTLEWLTAYQKKYQ